MEIEKFNKAELLLREIKIREKFLEDLHRLHDSKSSVVIGQDSCIRPEDYIYKVPLSENDKLFVTEHLIASTKKQIESLKAKFQEL